METDAPGAAPKTPVITVVKGAGRSEASGEPAAKGGGKRKIAMIVGAVVVAILVIGYFSGGESSEDDGGESRPTSDTPSSRPSRSYVPDEACSRRFVRDHIKKYEECRVVAITRRGGDVVVCGRNNWAASGCPRRLTSDLQEIADMGETITDVCLTEQGRFVVLFGQNAARWNDIPSDMERALRDSNGGGEKIYSATFNDAGDWIVVASEHYYSSATWLRDWLADGRKRFGVLRAAAVSTDAAVAVYDRGFKFFGNIPEDLKQALRKAEFDVHIVKIAGESWFFASLFGDSYQAHM